jgi:hypothetical protein
MSCSAPIVRINQEHESKVNPQILISGEIHGDERVVSHGI